MDYDLTVASDDLENPLEKGSEATDRDSFKLLPEALRRLPSADRTTVSIVNKRPRWSEKSLSTEVHNIPPSASGLKRL
jgi:hypothetical protein